MVVDRLRCLDAILKISKSTPELEQSSGILLFSALDIALAGLEQIPTTLKVFLRHRLRDPIPFLLIVKHFFPFSFYLARILQAHALNWASSHGLCTEPSQ